MQHTMIFDVPSCRQRSRNLYLQSENHFQIACGRLLRRNVESRLSLPVSVGHRHICQIIAETCDAVLQAGINLICRIGIIQEIIIGSDFEIRSHCGIVSIIFGCRSGRRTPESELDNRLIPVMQTQLRPDSGKTVFLTETTHKRIPHINPNIHGVPQWIYVAYYFGQHHGSAVHPFRAGYGVKIKLTSGIIDLLYYR
ncbi:hypothetical protein IMSAGC006_02074 [Muribaculaceae bacterium]|nr:hypothetical protein IMSAGC006_02074 [Muribaculaceae bacterium]